MAIRKNTAPAAAQSVNASPDIQRTIAEALEVPAVIAGSVPFGRLARALAEAGLRTHYDGDRQAIVIEPQAQRNVADALVGVAWFNGLSRAERAYWLELAGSARPADAWRAFQAGGVAP